MCPHEHIVTVLSKQEVLENDGDIELAETEGSGSNRSGPSNDSKWMKNTSEYIFKEKKIDLSKENKKKIVLIIKITKATCHKKRKTPIF